MHRNELKSNLIDMLKQNGYWPEDVEAKKVLSYDIEKTIKQYESEIVKEIGEDIENLRNKVNARWTVDVKRICGAIKSAVGDHKDIIIPAGLMTSVAKRIWNNLLSSNEVETTKEN